MTRSEVLPCILFSGPFAAGQATCARDELCDRIRAGARDVLYVVGGGAAKREAVRELVRRRCAVFGVHVVTLAGLPREIERRARVHSPPALDALARELITERAVREACVGVFPEGAPLDGLARGVSSTIEALERCGATPERLEAEIGAGEDEGARLLLHAWHAVARLRPALGRTAAEASADAVRLLRGEPELLGGCDVVVLDSVPLEHALDRALVGALVMAAPGTVVAAYEAPRQLHDTTAARTLAAVREMSTWEERRCEPAATAFSSAVGRVFTTEAPPPGELPAGPEVCLLEAAGDAGEVRLAARTVRRHLRDGVPPEEIQIVLRSPGRHRDLIEETFTREGVPVAVARGRSVGETAMGDVLLRLLRAALDPAGCGRGESLALLRTPHVDLAAGPADRLERWVRTQGLLGFATWTELDPAWLSERTRQRVERFRGALLDAHHRLAALRDGTGAAPVARRLARELRLLGNAHFSRMRSLRRSGDGPALRRQAERAIREDNQAWEEIEAVLDRMPELLGYAGVSERLSGLPLAERWLATLGAAFRSVGAGSTVPSAGSVRVVGVGGAGTRPARVTLVLGMLEKAFPRQPRQDAFLHDELRRSLRKRQGWHLPTAEERAEQEREHFLRVISSAGEVLYLSCAATDREGKPALRSFFLQDLERVHPFARTERLGVSDVVPPVRDASGPADLLAVLAHDVWQHLPAAPAALQRRAAAFAAHDELARRGIDLGAVRGERRHEHPPVLDAALLEGAPHQTLRLSASQLRSIAHCTYRHYVEKVLAPSTLDAPAYDALGRGSLLHDAIMEWATELGGWSRGEAALEEIDRWVMDRVAAWPPSMSGSRSALHAADTSRRRLRDFLGAELSVAAAGGARPAYHELAFGEQADGAGRRDAASVAEAFPLVVATSQGERTVYFRGSVDRVDVFETGGRRYGVAIDYKTGRTSSHYAKEMLAGHDLQLRLYLLALERFWGIVPAGALYLGFGDGVRRGAVRADLEPFIPGLGSTAEVKRLEPTDWDHFVRVDTPERIATLVDRLVRRDITAAPNRNDCGFCNLRSICRYDRFADEPVHV